jgi:hypothetical protein
MDDRLSVRGLAKHSRNLFTSLLDTPNVHRSPVHPIEVQRLVGVPYLLPVQGGGIFCGRFHTLPEHADRTTLTLPSRSIKPEVWTHQLARLRCAWTVALLSKIGAPRGGRSEAERLDAAPALRTLPAEKMGSPLPAAGFFSLRFLVLQLGRELVFGFADLIQQLVELLRRYLLPRRHRPQHVH